MADPQPGDLDYTELIKASRRLEPAATSQTVRLALLSDAATQRLVPLVRVLLHRCGIDASLYEGPFDGVELDVYNPSSELYAFRPDFVFVLNSVQALRARF